MQAATDIVGRAADERLGVALLEELSQRRFHESRSGTDEGNHPHPEHSAGTAHGDGGGYAGEVTRADACGHRDGKGLERRHMFLVALAGHRGIGQQTHHLAQHTELHEARAPREPHSAA